MRSPIKWLEKAIRNFDTAIAYIARDDPKAATIVARRMNEAVSLLASHPAMGRPGRVNGTRELVVPDTRYLIPYRVRNGVIEILRVFHASRRPPKGW